MANEATTLAAFLAPNVEKAEGEEYVATNRIKDPKTGKPVPWKLQPVDTETMTRLRKECSRQVPVPGKRGMYTRETDSEKFVKMLTAKTVVFPDLNNAQLQDSWGVMGAENLLNRMLIPGEYDDLVMKVQEVNGYDKDMDELVDQAKN
mgnify:FL=1